MTQQLALDGDRHRVIVCDRRRLGLVMSRSRHVHGRRSARGARGRAQGDISAKKQDLSSGILARPAAIDLGRPSFWTRMVPNAENLNLLYEQADVSFSFNRFMSVVGGLAVTGAVFGLVFRLPIHRGPGWWRFSGAHCRSSGSCTGAGGGSTSSSRRCPKPSS